MKKVINFFKSIFIELGHNSNYKEEIKNISIEIYFDSDLLFIKNNGKSTKFNMILITFYDKNDSKIKPENLAEYERLGLIKKISIISKTSDGSLASALIFGKDSEKINLLLMNKYKDETKYIYYLDEFIEL